MSYGPFTDSYMTPLDTSENRNHLLMFEAQR